MKQVSHRPVVIALLILAIFALACASGSRTTTTTQAQQQEYETPPMQGGAFMNLQSELREIPDPQVRLQRVANAANQNHFLSSQVRGLINLFEETEDRYTVVELTRFRIVDMNNTYGIVTSFGPGEREHVHALLEEVHEQVRAEEARAAAEEERRREEQRAERAARRAEQQESMQGFMEGASGMMMGDDDFDDRPSRSSGASAASSRPIAPLPPAGASAMSNSAFQQLKQRVDDAGMGSDKVGTIETAAASNFFSAAQVAELIQLIPMSGDQVSAVGVVAHRILDLENSHVVTGAFDIPSGEREAREILATASREREQEQARAAAIEEERRREEARRQEEQQRRAQEQRSTASSSSSGSSSGSSSSSNYCCLGGSYNSCDSGAAVAACGSFGVCLGRCMMGGGSNCSNTCADQNPGISGCTADRSRDHLCE